MYEAQATLNTKYMGFGSRQRVARNTGTHINLLVFTVPFRAAAAVPRCSQ